ncbi:MAG: RagB/SusD family nutrient uptake outer membrane protein [Dysgonamonadaceae bacterium]|jgi:hypothetical protein|nr:RagB/SusD family nutrient uptake outer membrane protein [Dysgonamonadaceae bacterium]
MKNVIYYIFIVFIFVILTNSSCDNFLEKPPGVDVTEDTIFSSAKQFEYFVYGTYWWGVMSDLPYFDARAKFDCSTSTSTDESINNTYTWYYNMLVWNTANMNPTSNRNTGDPRWSTYWGAIRRCNIILERIDDAQFDDVSPAYADELKKTSKGEAFMIRAMQYFDLFKMYGGVPLVKKRLLSSDDLLIPRATLQETYDFILEDCEAAIALLPNPRDIPDNRRGRLSNVAAMHLKAKLMLYAASPLFNTATPYLPFGENNQLIIFGEYRKDRWKQAADAAKETIDAAEGNGIALVRNKTVIENNETKEIPYRYVWETVDNEEVILADQPYINRRFGHAPWNFSCSPLLGGSGGYYMTFNFLQKYSKADGNPQDWERSGNDFMKKIKELEPRFHQTVSYHGSYWTQEYPALDCAGGNQNNETGLIIHKPYPYALTSSSSPGIIPKGILFRLADLYLMYAEALNEYYDTPPADAYKYINLVKNRAGVASLPENLTKEQFREKVRNERAVEFCNEGHRLWDIQRWMIAEEDGVMTGDMLGFKLTKSGSEVSYVVYTATTRTYNRKMYRLPFLQNEVNKGYIIQNPGY